MNMIYYSIPTNTSTFSGLLCYTSRATRDTDHQPLDQIARSQNVFVGDNQLSQLTSSSVIRSFNSLVEISKFFLHHDFVPS